MKTIIEQYQSLKEKHPHAILFFHVGDFFEAFGEDAVTTGAALGLVVTVRRDGWDQTGFVQFDLEQNLSKMIRAGHRVAVIEKFS